MVYIVLHLQHNFQYQANNTGYKKRIHALSLFIMVKAEAKYGYSMTVTVLPQVFKPSMHTFIGEKDKYST